MISDEFDREASRKRLHKMADLELRQHSKAARDLFESELGESRELGSRCTAKIRAILTGVHGALLEKRIGRFRVWNLDQLRLVKRNKAK